MCFLIGKFKYSTDLNLATTKYKINLSNNVQTVIFKTIIR